MPPRKAKIAKQVIDETPVVFFLKVSDEDLSVDPAEHNTTYADILNTVEAGRNTDTTRFNTDLLKSVLDKVVKDNYTPQTACFWCCHQFDWVGCVLPRSYDAYKNIYTCEGNFCSPECALAFAYNDNKTSDATKWSHHALLGDLYSSLYKTRLLSPAPPRTLLRLFGGPLDIEQYRDFLYGSNDIVLSEMPPIRLHFPSMNVQGPLRDIKKFVSLSTDVVEKASEQLRLKRSKPVSSNIQTLDMCIKGQRAT
jgi:hypothetical protein